MKTDGFNELINYYYDRFDAWLDSSYNLDGMDYDHLERKVKEIIEKEYDEHLVDGSIEDATALDEDIKRSICKELNL